MRLSRLDLLRYGHFTGRSVDFPRAPRDLHLIFGPNEAGKSTALTAIEDLLFGIPMHSALNFLHGYKDMRLGAVLEAANERLEFRRRKGNKNTLLGADEQPLAGGDAMLQPFLAGAHREFFQRMFSLDHQRLEKGGKDILDARDEIGQMLFAASAGISDLRQRLETLEQEADDLWGSRRSGQRLYTKAADRLEQAERNLREHTITATQWEEKRAAAAAADATHATLEAEYMGLQAERRRLARIRRVHRDVRRKQDLSRELAELGTVAAIPDGTEQQLAGAESQALRATIRIDTLAERIRETTEQLAGLTVDEDLLRRSEDVQFVYELRIKARGARDDLPRRQAELAAAEDRLMALARELGWRSDAADTVLETLPPRPKLYLVRALLAERGSAASALESAREAFRDAGARQQGIRERLAALPNAPDRSGLAAAVAVVTALGDLSGRLQATIQEQDQARRDVQRWHRELRPALDAPEDVARITVPTRQQVQRQRDLWLDWEQRDRDLRRQTQDAEAEWVRLQRVLERASRERGELSAEDLHQAREFRDELWALIERRDLQGEALSLEEQTRFADVLGALPERFQRALRHADEIADRRFEHAEAVGRLIQMTDAVEAQRGVVEGLVQRRVALDAEQQELRTGWRTLWKGGPVSPLAPDTMLAWLEVREELLASLAAGETAAARHAALREEEQRVSELLLAELERHGFAREEFKPMAVPVLLQRAVDLQHALEKDEAARHRAEEELHTVGEEVMRRRGELERAEAAWTDWEQRWVLALGDLGLRQETDPQEIARQLEVIEELHSVAAQIHSLRRDRIEKIQRDIDAFEQQARSLVGELATDLVADLAKRLPEDVVAELEGRLKSAQETHKLRLDREDQRRTLEREHATEAERLRQAQAVLQQLMAIAGVASISDLRVAIERDAAVRRLRGEWLQTSQLLEQQGDGLSVAELEQECAGTDIDQAAAREDALEQELQELRHRLESAVESRAAARDAFAAIGGDDAAARAAAARQEALADLRSVSERYVRIRTAAELLKWAIDRYRRDKQAPMLRRAGEIFSALTEGVFSALHVDYDERDQPQLLGLRTEGTSVAVPGLSTGTADQLYLALRIAAIEDYLEAAPGLPFVADDLFINFDDQRAAAGLEVLAQFAERTQVLFFTHHRHLVDIAYERFGDHLHVEFLADP